MNKKPGKMTAAEKIAAVDIHTVRPNETARRETLKTRDTEQKTKTQ